MSLRALFAWALLAANVLAVVIALVAAATLASGKAPAVLFFVAAFAGCAGAIQAMYAIEDEMEASH